LGKLSDECHPAPQSKLIHLLIATEDKLRTCYSDWSWDVLLGCCLLSAS
jgi:hypothetical protein